LAPGLEIASILYHDVVDNPKDSGFQRPSAIPYKHTLFEFGQNLDRIAKSPVTPGLVFDIDFVRPGRHLLLTFDDGGKSALYVNDELCKRNWKAHFFITTSLIGNRTFLDANGVRYLRSCGHIIGSHSHTHPDIFKDIPFHKMMEEWAISCDILSQMLGNPCITASAPGGDVSAKVLRSANAAGIRYLFTSDPSLTPHKEGNCWILGRVCPKAGSSLSRVEEFVQFRGWARELMRRRAKVLLRTILFPLYRSYVRRTTREWSK
jgi:peptidoglycan/xylan/chitin deacetylase (PgdA/CDA1 family)